VNDPGVNDVHSAPTLALRRIYAVTPDKVWRAWTDPPALARWFGPGGPDSVRHAELDLRVGGRYRIVFLAPDGSEHEASGRYRVVEPHRLLVFSWSRRGLPEAESEVRIELRAVASGTELSFVHTFSNLAARDDHEIGWLPTFAKLEAFLQEALR
jgi:uncharacterized protein YndB with AHSA1/START domain